MKKIEINEKFRKYLFPLSNEEYETLKESIKNEGLIQPITIWNDYFNESSYIVDGHNRYNICNELNIEPLFIEKEFKTEDDVLEWIDRNQFGRRNLNDLQRKIVIGRMYESRKKQGLRNDLTSTQNGKKLWTSEKISDELGIGKNTVIRASKMHLNLEKIKNKDEEIYDKIVSGEIKVKDNEIETIKDNLDTFKKLVKHGINKNFSTEIKRKEIIKNNEELIKQEIIKPTGKYDVIVIDPAWEMKKIERDVTPEQVEFNYPTMTNQEILDIEIPASDKCHIFLWTTQKYLPFAFECLKKWNVNYVLTFVWHKNGGFQPFGLPQYNCEFCLYGRIGTPEFIDFKAFNTCFNADRTKHSEKPEYFYELLNRVTSGRKLDMFNRRKINGFIGYGNEAK